MNKTVSLAALAFTTIATAQTSPPAFSISPASSTFPSTRSTIADDADPLFKFRHLHRGMKLAETRALLGPPTLDPGSAVPHEIYVLPDHSQVELLFPGMELRSVKHGAEELLPR